MAEEEEEEKIPMRTNAGAANANAEDELSALKKELEEAETELKKWSARVEKAILDEDEEKEKKYKEQQKIYLDRVKDLEGQITKKETTASSRTIPVEEAIEKELTDLKRELAKAEAELKEWSARVEKAIDEKAPDKDKEELKEQQKIRLDRVKDLEGQIAELKKETTASSRTIPVAEAIEKELTDLKRELAKAEAELKEWSARVEKAILDEDEGKEKKYKDERKIYLDRVKAFEGQIAKKEATASSRTIPAEEAIAKVFRKIKWKESVTEFEPKLWMPSSHTDPAIAQSVRDAKVYGRFLYPEEPDFLLTEMQRGWTSSTQLLQYSYDNGSFKYQGEILHQSLNDYDTVVLIGTSGAGKTATSLRLAANSYTILFVSDPRGNDGSSDVKHLAEKAEVRYSSSKNHQQIDGFVQDQFRKLLLFRKHLLEACRSRYANFSPLHWVMAQLYPKQLFGVELFVEFLELPVERVVSLPSLDEFRWIVVDEVQLLDSMLQGVFPSREKGGLGQSLLAPFVRTLDDIKVSKLLCGTGLSSSYVAYPDIAPIKASASTIVVGVATYLDEANVEDALKGWGVPTGSDTTKKACALFAGRPRQAAYLAAEMIANNGEILGTSAAMLKALFNTALNVTHGLDPGHPKRGVMGDAGDDLFAVLQEAALNYVLGRPGVVRTGGFFAVQRGICTLAPRLREEMDFPPSKKQKLEGECVIAEALVVRAFSNPMVDIFESKILKSTNHSDVGFTVEDYLALRHATLTGAVKIAATRGMKEFKIPCGAYDRDWKYLDKDYYVQIVARCSKPGEETTVLRRWLEQKKCGVIMPVTAHGADIIVLVWNMDLPLVIIVHSKSGESVSTREAFLSLQLPYTTDRKAGLKVTSALGKEWEKLLTEKKCLVAYIVFKPLEGSRRKAVSWENERLLVIIDKNSWQEFAQELKPGIDNFSKLKSET